MAASGRCKLTNRTGAFVKSHILPLSLTRPTGRSGFIQAGIGDMPIKRWSSWYDDAIVTRDGEDILARLDTWGVKELRRLQLVWSGWNSNNFTDLPEVAEITGTDWYLRQLSVDQPLRLRKFFHSILWRAAVSERFEFAEIMLPSADTEILRRHIVSDEELSEDFYPVQLVQLATRADRHNYSPVSDEKTIPEAGGHHPNRVPIYRFYMDGLIFHFERPHTASQKLENLSVGVGKNLHTIAIKSEKSRQYELLEHVASHAYENWPSLMMRLAPQDE